MPWENVVQTYMYVDSVAQPCSLIRSCFIHIGFPILISWQCSSWSALMLLLIWGNIVNMILNKDLSWHLWYTTCSRDVKHSVLNLILWYSRSYWVTSRFIKMLSIKGTFTGYIFICKLYLLRNEISWNKISIYLLVLIIMIFFYTTSLWNN